ncbi:unnamed protein product [Camellia sinensis]
MLKGKDTRKAFTDHLYTALVQAGIRTFKDNEDIERGEKIKLELQKAIWLSRISVIVFSKDYASSRWCLDELLMILEFKRTSKHIVLPIFYDVDPAEVKNQTGGLAEDFVRHEQIEAEGNERKTEWMKKVKQWRAALREVADLGGMVLPNQADGHESKFIQKIVKVIEDKVNRKILSVAPCLIGMDSRVTSINLWLQDESTDVGVLVICGMGGIGKTTIPKFVYNLNYRRFEGSSFLANIREVSEQPNGLVRLQRQLLSDILKRKKENIHSVDEGIIKIKDVVSCKRSLVVLDDVDQVDQLDALIGIRDWFHPGSKVIITTRHERLLQPHKDHEVHNVEKLDEDESCELFSWHAFGQNHPIKVFMEHSKRVVQYCGGLPLALQVLGSSLSGKSVDVWESALEKLKTIPESQIVNKLKISYDSLQDDHDKNLFLHIACFFVGKDKDFSVRMLDECDFYTTSGIQNLIDRCLVTIDKNNKMMMSQLLQDMGREIIRQESPKEPGKRSRLWHHKDSFNVLREKTGTETVEGLVLDVHMLMETKSARSLISAYNSKHHHFKEYFLDKSLSEQRNSLKQHCFGFLSSYPTGTELKNSNKLDLKTDAFARMHKLRLLQLNYVQLSGNYGEFPKGLRWLCCCGFPSKFLPIDFPLESLVALDLRYSSLKRVWNGTKFLGLLKTLNLSHSHSLAKTPNFSLLPNLERLILKDFWDFSLPIEIQGLFKLQPIGKVETEMIKNLGDFNLESMANIEVNFINCALLTNIKG